MIDQQTVFVIGAGAHVPFGFPPGTELKEQILNLGWNEVWQHRQWQHSLESFQEQFRASGRDSIDAFLERRPEFLEVGKICIAHCIGKCEHKERRLWKEDWISWLLNGPMNAQSLEEYAKNQVVFVTFNYDRFLEHHLFDMLQARFGAEKQAVAEALSSTKVIHVHGSLGLLPWQASGDEARIPFGSVQDDVAVKIDSSRNIKLVHEAKPQPEEVRITNVVLNEARLVFLLGYGYHPENNRKLQINYGTAGVHVFGTGFGLTDAERDRLKVALFKASDSPNWSLQPGQANMGVLEFFRNCPSLLAMTPL